YNKPAKTSRPKASVPKRCHPASGVYEPGGKKEATRESIVSAFIFTTNGERETSQSLPSWNIFHESSHILKSSYSPAKNQESTKHKKINELYPHNTGRFIFFIENLLPMLMPILFFPSGRPD